MYQIQFRPQTPLGELTELPRPLAELVDSREISKIVATRCQIFRLKCTKFNFGWGSAPDQIPLEELTALPQTP